MFILSGQVYSKHVLFNKLCFPTLQNISQSSTKQNSKIWYLLPLISSHVHPIAHPIFSTSDHQSYLFEPHPVPSDNSHKSLSTIPSIMSYRKGRCTLLV